MGQSEGTAEPQAGEMPPMLNQQCDARSSQPVAAAAAAEAAGKQVQAQLGEKQTELLTVARARGSNMSRRNSLIDPNTIRAHGPGLQGGRVGEECKFRIEGTDGGLALSFHIEGPSRPMFETCACNDLSLDISYIPTQPGDYKLSLLWYGKHLEGSPFALKVQGDRPAPSLEELVKKIKVSGKGLECGRTQEYNEILIDCRRVYLKDHKLRCTVKSPPKSSAMVKLEDNFDGTYSMFFKPTFPGNYSLNIRVDDIHVLGSPFTAIVRN